MKIFMYLLVLISAVLVVYNLTQINFEDPLGKDSIVALITVVAGLCTILIVAILRISKKIEDTLKKKK